MGFNYADLTSHPETVPEVRAGDIVLANAEAPAAQPQASPVPQAPAQTDAPTLTIRLEATQITIETRWCSST